MTDESSAESLNSLNEAAGRKPWLAILFLIAAVGMALTAMIAGSGTVALGLKSSADEAHSAPAAQTPERSAHLVVKGDTLALIGNDYHVTVDQLRTWNALSGDLIEVGDRLWLEPPLPPAVLVEQPAPENISSRVGLFGAAAGATSLVTGALAVGAVIAAIFAWWRHAVNRVTIILFDLDPPALAMAQARHDAIAELGAAGRVWHVSAKGSVTDWKRNSGASSLVKRAVVWPTAGDPPRIRTNVAVFGLPAGREVLYFMPDRLLVYDTWRSRYGAVRYEDLNLEVDTTRFIEEDSVPRDADVIDHTWARVNRDGGPDRRFRDNRQLPVCRYGTIQFTAPSGLQELYQVSNVQRLAHIVAVFARDADAAAPADKQARRMPAAVEQSLGVAESNVRRVACAMVLLMRSITAADRKIVDAELAAMQVALCNAFPREPWIVEKSAMLVRADPADLARWASVPAPPNEVAGAAAYFTEAPEDARVALFETAKAISVADGKATPKEREKLALLASLLGLP